MCMSGVQVTLIYAIIGTVAGFIIGLILGGIRALEINDSDSAAVKVLKRIGRLFTSLYIWVFRGTPMMVPFRVVIPLREISDVDVGFASGVMMLKPGTCPLISWAGSVDGVLMKFSDLIEEIALATSPFF